MALQCDSNQGVCTLDSPTNDFPKGHLDDHNRMIYIGDPMCSWCWGLSPILKQLQEYCQKNNISFSPILGGLRPGGGDPWTEGFKSFLKHEWERIEIITGQKFVFDLLSKEFFNYDTEPACRAVAVARKLLIENEIKQHTLLHFFSSIQEKFYTLGQDPTDIQFYHEICAKFEINFEEFCHHYNDVNTKNELLQEFQMARHIMVRGMPFVGLYHQGILHHIALNHESFDVIQASIKTILNKES